MQRIFFTVLAAVAFDASAENGCFANFSDRRSQAILTINASNPSVFQYSPRCARISAGTTVQFVLSSMHPTFGGVVTDEGPVEDDASPIGPWTPQTTQTFTVLLDRVGEFPYYCDFHVDVGMFGSILVVPETFADGFE